MTIYVFTGPTLTAEQGRRILDAVYLPPVEQGDVYALTLRAPAAIGIIDGRYRDVPAVWHKEILWALSRGVPVYGSASMGALRAAELAPYGMRGVGRVFEEYRDGIVEDDDEVAVGHADEEFGFVATSDAMVNIRRTVRAAVDHGRIGADTADRLTALVKAAYFTERSYGLLLRLGREAGLPAGELDRLSGWLPDNRIDQKRADAEKMLRVMRDDRASGGHPSPAFAFQHTAAFERARSAVSTHACDEAVGGRVSRGALLAELRLDPDAYARVRDRAVARCLAVRLEESYRTDCVPDDLAATTAAFDAAQRRVAGELDRFIANQLRTDGLHAALESRADAKRRLLAGHGLDDPAGAPPGDPGEPALLDWYFGRLGTGVPVDLDAHAHGLGLADNRSFVGLVRREYWFSTLAGDTDPAGLSGTRTD